MKRICKFIVSACLSVAISFSLSANTFATDFPSLDYTLAEEIKIVNGYECYLIDGEYYADINGKMQPVIILDQGNEVTDKEVLEYLNNQINENTMTRSTSTTIDLTDGTVYNGDVDVTSSDYDSPMFKIDLTGDLPLAFHIGFWANRTISMRFYYYLSSSAKWYYKDLTITLNLFYQTRYLLEDTALRTATYCHFTIFSEGTTPQQVFDYDIYHGW